MEKLVENFPTQVREALAIAHSAKITASAQPIHHVLVAGLGGSGIGGNLIAELIKDECKVPFLITKGYEMPAYVGANSLVILSSYSGNTEETLTIFEQAKNTGAKIVCVSSGGKLLAFAKEYDLDYIVLPGGMPPRSCLGYSSIQLVAILTQMGLISDRLINELGGVADLLENEQSDIKINASAIAQLLLNKIPIIYTTDRMESVAVRFRQQLNENSKILCWHHVIPEMNHNELVGWRDQSDQWAVILFRNKDDNQRNQYRIDINKEVFNAYAPTIIEIYSKGNNLAEKAFYFVHLGDFISTELAKLRGVDAVEVRVIDFLKNELSKIN